MDHCHVLKWGYTITNLYLKTPQIFWSDMLFWNAIIYFLFFIHKNWVLQSCFEITKLNWSFHFLPGVLFYPVFLCNHVCKPF